MQEEVCGILVDVKEYREHDALLKVLCEDGSLLSLSARGVRKVTSKNAPAVQLFTLARLQLNYQQTASIQSLRRAEIINSYRKIREDLVKQSIASYFCECIYRSGFEENVYILLKQSLDILQDAKHSELNRLWMAVSAVRARSIFRQCREEMAALFAKAVCDMAIMSYRAGI